MANTHALDTNSVDNDDDDDRPVRVLSASDGWRMFNAREVWAYRELFFVLAARDIKVRYKQTVLGASWAILQPLASMIVFTVVFGHFAKMPSDDLPYPVFVYAGMLPWTFFSASLNGAANSLLSSGHLVTKVYFPRIIIPLAAVGSALVDFFVALLLLFVLMGIYGVPPTWGLAFAPIVVVGMLFCSLGVGTLLSGVAARYRDFRYVIPFAVQLWMYASPVVYPSSLVPETVRWVLYLNPMAGFIDAFRAAFLGAPLDVTAVGISLAVSVVFFVFGALVFSRVERRIADIL